MGFASGSGHYPGFILAFGNTSSDFFEKYSIYDLFCMYWSFSQQLDCYRTIDNSDFNDLNNDDVRNVFMNRDWIIKTLKEKWVKTLPPLEYAITKMDLLEFIYNPNSYENEENYLYFLQDKIPALMKGKKRDEITVNKLLFKVHFEEKK